jgi:hypothetical protein
MDRSNINMSRIKGVVVLSLFVLMIFYSVSYAQCGDEKNSNGILWDFDEQSNEDFDIGIFLSGIFTPQIIIDTKYIRRYINDERFQHLRTRCGDMRSIDAIYLKSLKIADYNIARALFLSLMGVLEHRNVDVKIPMISTVTVPLTFEKDSLFFVRIKHLPSHVYDDSPTSSEGDRDKLQHFFGSAYLSYTSEAPEFARTVGNIIEWGEAVFVLGGTDDPRDKRANKQGESFGRDLLVVKTLLPSDYLTFHHKGHN